MTKTKLIFTILAVVASWIVLFFLLSRENVLVFQPKGIIAKKQFDLILINVFLMGIILVPTFFWLLIVAWKYRADNQKVKYEPKKITWWVNEIMLWVIPSIIVAIMAVITWNATHELDPYRPLESKEKNLTIQVIALNWKWLFIYPDQGIATLNYVQFPEKTPIRFELAADAAPMNSFWIPELSGQIYCMTGMITPLHIMANGRGTYSGKAAEINGEGYARMTFVAESTSPSEFEAWISQVKKSPLKLDEVRYSQLLQPSFNLPPEMYSYVKKDLFHNIVMQVHNPTQKP